MKDFSRSRGAWFLSISRGVAAAQVLLAWILVPWQIPAAPQEAVADYGPAIAELESVAREIISEGGLSGVSMALVDGQRIVYVNGFGFADKERRVRARGDTVYRAGSISKLFTALAAMQQEELGRIDLDRPVASCLPEFRIVVPFENSPSITLRQLMCHRSGLIRESPVGGYFDDREPTFAAAVASIADCVLVYPAGTRTKYSNIGVTVVGHAVERVAGVPFVEYQRHALLGPLGMKSSSFLLSRDLRKRLAKGYMRVADGRGGFKEIEAPCFELGTLPAGNLYTTAEDLARFLLFLFAAGRAGDQPLIREETLEKMFTPQLTDEATGYGLGFYVGEFGRKKKISHTGAVYGFTSALAGMPGDKLGAVVLANDDLATGPVKRLNDLALALLLQGKGQELTKSPEPSNAAPADLAEFAGDFESESYWAQIALSTAGLKAEVSGQALTLIESGPLSFKASGRYAHESPFVFQRDDAGNISKFNALGQEFTRVRAEPAVAIPDSWRRYAGTYGPSFIPLVVSVRHGHLYAMTENMFDYRLTPLNRTVFKMPPGLYTDEHLVFHIDKRGRVHSVTLANMTLPRTGGSR